MQDIVKGDSRRKSNAERQRRNRQRIIRAYAQMIFIIVAVIVTVLSFTVFFNIEQINVAGDSDFDRTEIVTASGLDIGQNMLRTKMSSHAEDVMRSVVYLESCTIKREFPNSVNIYVEVCKPAACLETDSGYLIMSGTGKIFDTADTPPDGIYLIKGSEPAPGLIPGDMFESDDEGKLSAMLTVIEAMNSRQTDKVTYIDMTDRYNIKYMYDNRIEVCLGSTNELDYKLKFTDVILKEKIGSKTEGVLTMFSGSASFREKSGIEQYYQNIQDRLNGVTETEAETDENGDPVETSETSASE